MKRTIKASLGWLGRKMRKHFFAGILITVPVGLTVWIFIQLFYLVDGFLQDEIVKRIWGREIPGVGFGVTVLLIYLIGVIASNVLGRRLLRYGESLLERIPVARHVYSGIRQITQSFSTPGRTGFMQVVLIEFPRRGTRTIGFITNVESDKSGNKLYNVFIPTSPNPTSGFLQIVKEEEIIRTEISVDAALRMVVSGGRVSPKEVRDKLLEVSQEEQLFDRSPDSSNVAPDEGAALTKGGKREKAGPRKRKV